MATLAETVWYEGVSASPLTVVKPGGFEPGQILIAVIVGFNSPLSELTAPGDWTEKGSYTNVNNYSGKVFVHAYDAGDPATWDFTYNAADSVCLALLRCANSEAALVVTTRVTDAMFSSEDSPSVTPTAGNDLLICLLSQGEWFDHFTHVVPVGMSYSGQTTNTYLALVAAAEQLSSPAPTGVRTWTSLDTGGSGVGGLSIAVASTAPEPDLYLPGKDLPPHLIYRLFARKRSLEVSPIPIVGHVATGAVAVGTTSCAAAYPPGIEAGDALWLGGGACHSTVVTFPVISGWTLIYDLELGGGAIGAGTGPRRVGLYYRLADGTETGTVTVTPTGGSDVVQASITCWRPTTGKVFSVIYEFGQDTSPGAPTSVGAGSLLGETAGDVMLVFTVQPADTNISSQTMNATGATYGTPVEHVDTGTTTGDDQRCSWVSRPITAGTAIAATVYTATSTQSAGCLFLRLREAAPPAGSAEHPPFMTSQYAGYY